MNPASPFPAYHTVSNAILRRLLLYSVFVIYLLSSTKGKVINVQRKKIEQLGFVNCRTEGWKMEGEGMGIEI